MYILRSLIHDTSKRKKVLFLNNNLINTNMKCNDCGNIKNLQKREIKNGI